MTTVTRGKWARKVAVGTGAMAGMAIVGALVVATGSAKAGWKSDPCMVTYATDGAYGAMGAARDSADSNQLVRCDIIGADSSAVGTKPPANDGALSMFCVMIDATGAYPRSCVSSSRALIAAAQAVGDSRVTITIKAGSPASNPECGIIAVVNSSEFSPKTTTP